jgi:hypothetical protein
VEICDTEFDRGTIRRLCKPEVEVLTVFSSFQEEDIVARMQIGKSVESRVVIVV